MFNDIVRQTDEPFYSICLYWRITFEFYTRLNLKM